MTHPADLADDRPVVPHSGSGYRTRVTLMVVFVGRPDRSPSAFALVIGRPGAGGSGASLFRRMGQQAFDAPVGPARRR